MNLLLWIILGFISGWLASIVIKTDDSQSYFLDILFGMVGAVFAGFIFNFLGLTGFIELNLYSLLVAAIGAFVTIGFERMVNEI